MCSSAGVRCGDEGQAVELWPDAEGVSSGGGG